MSQKQIVPYRPRERIIERFNRPARRSQGDFQRRQYFRRPQRQSFRRVNNKKGKKRARKVAKLRKKVTRVSDVLSNVKIETRGNPTNRSKPLDMSALINMIEAEMAEYYVNSDLASAVDPWALFCYLWGCSMMHIRRVGVLTGEFGNQVPVQVTCNNFVIPPGLAKFLQYYGVYRELGPRVQTVFSWEEDFITSCDAWGANTPLVSGYTRLGNAEYQFYAMTEGGLLSADSANTIFPVTNATGSGISCIAMINDYTLMSSVSVALSSVPPAVTLGMIPATAPDGSAYAFLRGAPLAANPPPTTVPTSFCSICTRYDPEIALMYNISTFATDVGSYCDKPLPRHLYNVPLPNPYTVESFPWYCQPYSVLAWLGRKQDKFGKTGIKSAFRVMGTKLSSLFPSPQVIDGYSISLDAVAAWQVLLQNKQVPTSFDPNYQDFTLFMTMVFGVLQRAISYGEVIHTNQPLYECNQSIAYPTTQYANGAFVAPQLVYTNTSWDTVELPPQIMTPISGIGPIVVHGRLVIPVCDWSTGYLTWTTPGSSTGSVGVGTVPGPMNWSAYGYQASTDPDTVYSIPNQYTIAAAFEGTTTTPPNLLLYNDPASTPPANIDIDNFYITLLTSLQPGVNTFYPITINGTGFTTLTREWSEFMVTGNNVTQPQFTSLTVNELGEAGPMATQYDYDPADVSMTLVNPNMGTTNVGQVRVPIINPGSSSSVSNLTEIDHYVGSMVGSSSNAHPDNPVALRSYKIRVKRWKLGAGAKPDYAVNMNSFITNFTTSSGWFSTLANVARDFMNPNSPVGKGIQKAIDTKISGLVHDEEVKEKPKVTTYIKNALKTFAHGLFASAQHYITADLPTVEKKWQAKVIGKMNPTAVKNVETLMAKARIKTNDSTPAVVTGQANSSTWDKLKWFYTAPVTGSNIKTAAKGLYEGTKKGVKEIESWF